jgi:hypothetical protein
VLLFCALEVRTVENKEIVSICTSKINIDQVGLFEDISKTPYNKTVQILDMCFAWLGEDKYSGWWSAL